MKHKVMNSFEIVLGIFLVTLVRTFLENFSNPEPVGGFTGAMLLVGYFLFYAVIVFSIGIFMGWLLNESWIKHISRTMRFSPIIWIAPIIDLVTTQGACMAYIGTTGTRLLNDFVTFFGPFPQWCGITMGIRIEILIIIIFTALYIWKKTKSFWKTIFGPLGIYSIVFLNLALPGIIRSFGDTTLPIRTFFDNFYNTSLLGSIHSITFASGTDRLMEQIALFASRIPWIIIIFLLAMLFWKSFPQQVIAWMKNVRLTRTMYYLIIAMSGIFFASQYHDVILPHTFLDILSYIIFFTSIIFHWWTAVAINDIADISIDQVSNAHRPLISGTISQKELTHIGFISGIIGISGGLLINWNVFMMFIVFQTAYTIYSVEPFRLKKHFVPASLLIGIAGLSAFLAGYFLISPDQSFASIPHYVMSTILITLIILSHTKDFKDVTGDKKEGIQTLPVVFGTRKASKILSITLLIWTLLTAFFFKNIWILVIFLPVFLFDLFIKIRIPEYVRFLILFIQIIFLWIIFS